MLLDDDEQSRPGLVCDLGEVTRPSSADANSPKPASGSTTRDIEFLKKLENPGLLFALREVLAHLRGAAPCTTSTTWRYPPTDGTSCPDGLTGGGASG